MPCAFCNLSSSSNGSDTLYLSINYHIIVLFGFTACRSLGTTDRFFRFYMLKKNFRARGEWTFLDKPFYYNSFPDNLFFQLLMDAYIMHILSIENELYTNMHRKFWKERYRALYLRPEHITWFYTLPHEVLAVGISWIGFNI